MRGTQLVSGAVGRYKNLVRNADGEFKSKMFGLAAKEEGRLRLACKAGRDDFMAHWHQEHDILGQRAASS